MAELLALFVLAPTSLWVARQHGWTVPVLPLLALLGALALLYLRRVAPERLRHAWRLPRGRGELARIALQTVLVGVAIVVCVLWVAPQWLLDLPTRQPARWVWLLALYPALSVVPQELVFRAFFFHRYEALLRRPAGQIVVSALVFGLAHLFYGHWLTVAFACAGGACFAWTFVRTGSLALVVLEHSGYGLLLFTLGLGRLFHTGAP